jgi:predicted  nucleic acid-binding Zn-ribbon protein
MAIRITPEEYADKQARRLKASIDDIRSGIEKVDQAPTALAAQKQDKMLQNLTHAVQSGVWASRLKAVSLDEWKDKALNKGLGRIASGIDGAKDKQVQFASQLLEYQKGLLSKVEKMPDLTLEDSINRMTEWVRGMSKFSKK